MNFDELVIRQGAPTLAGLKTGCLFTWVCPSREELLGQLRRTNGQLRAKGLMLLPLGHVKERVLLYLYRPERLKEDLASDGEAAALLRELGYGREENRIVQLIRRLRKSGEFPHEIGLFLGYPPEDVAGFIENRGACCKCSGTWKVYGDPEEAQLRFRRFRSCTDCYLRQTRSGKTLSELSVAM